MRKLKELGPDIVVVGALWTSYRHIEKIGEMLRFLQRIGVRRIVVIGEVPTWPLPLQQMLYRAYKADPLHKIPDRLSSFEKDLPGHRTTAQGHHVQLRRDLHICA